MNGYGYAFQATKCLHRVLLCAVGCSVVALRIELSAIRLSDAGFVFWLTRGLQPSTTISSVGCVGIEPLSIAPNDLCQPLHFTPDSCYLSGQAGNRTLSP
jgi:hypothetical protein